MPESEKCNFHVVMLVTGCTAVGVIFVVFDSLRTSRLTEGFEVRSSLVNGCFGLVCAIVILFIHVHQHQLSTRMPTRCSERYSASNISR